MSFVDTILGLGLIGILLGFFFERAYDSYKDRANRKKLKENLKNELETCVNRLDGQGRLLPTTMYSSAISTGDLKLLSFEERTRLASIYFAIDNQNYEAKRVGDSAVVANTGDRSSLADGMTMAKAYWVSLSKQLIESERVLKNSISELLKDKMWN